MAKNKMKLSEVVSGAMALSQLADSKRLSWELQWEIGDISDSLEKHIERYNKEQKELLENYGEKVPGTNSYKVVNPVDREKYNEAIEALGGTEVNVEFEPLLFSKLEDAKLEVLGSEFKILRKHFIVRETIEKKDPVEKEKKDKEIKAKMGKA